MLSIHDMAKDFGDGLLLVNLLEIISSKSIKHNKNPKLIPQKLENLKFALDFLASEGIKLVNIGPNDLVEGNLKLILGLIWTIILRYQIQLSQGASAKQELLDWVRSKIPEYNINNFTKDWQDGKAICALAEAVLPGQMNLPADFRDPVSNAQMGIKKAEQNMKIPPILDAEDMVYNTDELSNMTYISYFRDYLDLAAREEEEALMARTPVAGKCLAYGPGVEPGNEAGIETNFTIEAINARGKRVAGPPYPHQFPVKIVGPTGEIPSSTVNNEDGTYRVTYTPVAPGNHTIEVTFKGNHIQKSPVQIYVNPSRPDPVKCRCYGPGLESAEAHNPATFTIEAINRLGDRITNGGHPFHVEVVDPYDVKTPAQIIDNNDGTYTVNYKPVDPGDHVVHVSLGRDKVADSPYTVPVSWNSDMACPHLSYADGPGLEPGRNKNTEPATFTIHAIKPDGTPSTNGGDLFDVQIEDPNKELITPKITNNGDGTYNVEYQPTLPGNYHIDVIQRNPEKPLFYDHVKNSPVDIDILPGADASQTIAYGPGLEPGLLDTQPAEFTIRAKDILGNDIKEGGDPFDVKIDGPSGPVLAQITDNQDGTYTVAYKPEEAGPHDIAVTLDDKNIKGSKFHVAIKPGAWPDNSTIENYTFVIRTVDRKGRNKVFGGEKVEVSIQKPSGAFQEDVKVQDLNNGTYKVSYKLDGQELGNYTVSVTIGGEHISGSPFIQTVV